MASGVPVVTSSSSSIPEVVGSAAVLVNPRDCKQLTDALHRVLTDEHLCKEMIAEGFTQVAKFNWYRVVRGVLGVYHEVYKRIDKQPVTVQAFMPRAIWNKLKNIEKIRTEAVDESDVQKAITFTGSLQP